MFMKKEAICPVGKEPLGWITKGEVNSFVCKDCGFIYTWDRVGKLRAPVKLKRTPQGCHCGTCNY